MKFVALTSVLLIFIGLIFASLFFDSSRAKAPGEATANQSNFYQPPTTVPGSTSAGGATSTPVANPDSIFRGPVGTPHIIGPSGPPPSY